MGGVDWLQNVNKLVILSTVYIILIVVKDASLVCMPTKNQIMSHFKVTSNVIFLSRVYKSLASIPALSCRLVYLNACCAIV